jgi:hypothetical protein
VTLSDNQQCISPLLFSRDLLYRALLQILLRCYQNGQYKHAGCFGHCIIGSMDCFVFVPLAILYLYTGSQIRSRRTLLSSLFFPHLTAYLQVTVQVYRMNILIMNHIIQWEKMKAKTSPNASGCCNLSRLSTCGRRLNILHLLSIPRVEK